LLPKQSLLGHPSWLKNEVWGPRAGIIFYSFF
jgi:hypothetical protein